MPSLRCSGGTCCSGEETSRSPMRIAPPSSLSKPAIWRSSVVLPQPEGPSTARNSPSLDVDARRRRGRVTAPNRFCAGRWSVAPRQHSVRAVCGAKSGRRPAIRATVTSDGDHRERRGVGGVAALLEGEDDDAERLGPGRPEQRRDRQLVEGGEEDQERARHGRRRDQREDDGDEAARQAGTGDLRGLFERAVELVDSR